jgi:glycosyltransferase involved in cell wall biosynthesis
VVDSDSTDKTRAIAEAHGARVIRFTWNGRYPKKKQWQLENIESANKWILFIDADERVTPALAREIAHALQNGDGAVTAYDITLAYVFAGRTLRHGHKVVKRALIDRTRTHFPALDDIGLPGMGELEGHYQPLTEGRIAHLQASITHDDPDPISTWFDRHNRYSDWEASLRRRGASAQARQNRSRQGRIFDRAPGKPLLFFVYSYIVRTGFLDGRAGFDYALALSLYYWQIGLKIRELKRLAEQG